jgi:Uma2 family endonuclease
MSQAAPRILQSQQAAETQWLRLSNLDWNEYTRFLRLFAERPGYRLTYDRGELEITSAVFEHGKDAYFLGRMVDALSEEWGIAIVAGGKVTIRRRRRQRGLEPDNCYWIANAGRASQRWSVVRSTPKAVAVCETDMPFCTASTARTRTSNVEYP